MSPHGRGQSPSVSRSSGVGSPAAVENTSRASTICCCSSTVSDVSTDATCSPQQLGLRSTTGSIHAVVPGGRYRIDASQNAVVHGLTDATDAPFSLQALSGTGTVTVEQRR